jgi:GAF domain
MMEGTRSPMDQYSSMGSGQSATMSQSAGAAVARQLSKSAELRFPGEDGGQSLAAWARRDLEATLQLLADRAQYITGGSGAAIALRDGDFIMCRASSGPSAPQVGSYFEVSSGLSGESVRTRKTLRCDDATSDPRVNYDSCKALGIASFAVMPIVRHNEVIGIFEIFSNQPRAFQERDLLALERMGEMVNTALDQVKNPRSKPELPGLGIDPVAVRNSDLPVSNSDISHAQGLLATERLGATDPKKLEGSISTEPLKSESEPPHLLDVNADLVPAVSAPSPTSGVGTCAQCGFPVSGGRKLCLDCEAALEKQHPAVTSSSPAPAFLAGLEAEKTGLKHWIVSHRYLLGTIVMTVATVLVLLFR